MQKIGQPESEAVSVLAIVTPDRCSNKLTTLWSYSGDFRFFYRLASIFLRTLTQRETKKIYMINSMIFNSMAMILFCRYRFCTISYKSYNKCVISVNIYLIRIHTPQESSCNRTNTKWARKKTPTIFFPVDNKGKTQIWVVWYIAHWLYFVRLQVK